MEQHKPNDFGDLAHSAGIMWLAVCAVNRTVQVWSRWPGTAGGWFFGVFFCIGIAVQAWFYEVNVHTTRSPDFVPFQLVAGMSLVWCAVHSVAHSWQSLRGRRFHSYEPGIGILSRLFPRWQPMHQGLASDLAVAMCLSLLLHLAGSPIQSRWYAGMCLWVLVAHVWLHVGLRRRLRHWNDRRIEAERWSQVTRR